LADDAVVAVKAICEPKQPVVEHLGSRGERGEEFVCDFVIKAEKERFVEMFQQWQLWGCRVRGGAWGRGWRGWGARERRENVVCFCRRAHVRVNF